MKSQVITKVSSNRLFPLLAMNVCTTFHIQIILGSWKYNFIFQVT